MKSSFNKPQSEAITHGKGPALILAGPGSGKTLVKYVEEKGCKNGYVMWPIRTAVSGKQMTPGGATELMEVLGKEESIARIKKGISMLQK